MVAASQSIVNGQPPSGTEKLEAGRGRRAHGPQQIPPRGWLDVGRRVWRKIDEHNVFVVSGGVAFFAMASLFPALIALIASYGLFADPADVETSLGFLRELVPPEAFTIIQDQTHDIVTQSGTTKGWSLLLSIAGAVWAASSGMRALMTGLNIVYDETEKRGTLLVYLLALGFTLGALLCLLVGLGLFGGVAVLLYEWDPTLSVVMGWPLALLVFSTALAVLYRYAPSREDPRWQWVTWGSTFAALGWAAASLGFGFYAAQFGDYQKTYGTLAGVLLLLMWLYVTALVILVGAQINAELEAQTAIDSTTDAPRPMGQRGARKADELGEVR
jgi:membrane protein